MPFVEQIIYVPVTSGVSSTSASPAWQSAVNTSSDLPPVASYVGEVRYVITEQAFYYFNGSTWNPLGSGSPASYLDGGTFG